ncbi:hypothetical protein AC579_8129 [Pseudocercospora musae]|uniref:Uncharacterized protein n=1 Tax=Pseudocercospora musae TaxID=113226 RepID=A0A139IGJ7_9PEZI|nr:hypothetical protein AC579_8129 [Pseudocercospora musae]
MELRIIGLAKKIGIQNAFSGIDMTRSTTMMILGLSVTMKTTRAGPRGGVGSIHYEPEDGG